MQQQMVINEHGGNPWRKQKKLKMLVDPLFFIFAMTDYDVTATVKYKWNFSEIHSRTNNYKPSFYCLRKKFLVVFKRNSLR